MPAARGRLRQDDSEANVTDLHATRRAAAGAFVKEGLTKNKAWADLGYAYDYETEQAMYLGWFDDNGKKDTPTKISEAIAAYVVRFGTRPNVVLVNEGDWPVEVPGLSVRVEKYIRRNNFWVGFEYALT
jgi:hypothetical protein